MKNFLRMSMIVAIAAAATGARAACVVADPNPPLNVRMSPNGQLLHFKLENGQQLEIIDTKLSRGRIWVYVADASPLGWVLKNLVHCDDNGQW